MNVRTHAPATTARPDAVATDPYSETAEPLAATEARSVEYPGEPDIVVLPDAEAVADAAARLFLTTLTEAIAARKGADVALTGGSTPAAMYRRLVERDIRDVVPWSRVRLWWGDERFVPRDDPQSNVSLADDWLLGRDGIPIPDHNVHPFPTDRGLPEGDGEADSRGPEWCASTYAAELREAGLATVDGFPVFDLLLLGLGGDGHILSVFPGSEALRSNRVALPIPAPTHIEPHLTRVTLNPAVITVAGRVLVTVVGAAKADIVARALQGPRDAEALPATLARRHTATWLLDAAAASHLKGR